LKSAVAIGLTRWLNSQEKKDGSNRKVWQPRGSRDVADCSGVPGPQTTGAGTVYRKIRGGVRAVSRLRPRANVLDRIRKDGPLLHSEGDAFAPRFRDHCPGAHVLGGTG